MASSAPKGISEEIAAQAVEAYDQYVAKNAGA